MSALVSTAASDDALGAQLAAELGAMARPNVALAPLTTYRVGGEALALAAPASIDDLARIAEVARRHRLPTMVVGRGSNMLVADSGFHGIAYTLNAMGEHIDIHGTTVIVSGGSALPVVARRVSAAGLTGFEWAVGVPGSIGGAVRMNAGGHGSDMAACLTRVHLFDVRIGQHGWVPVERLGLRFRASDVADHQVVIEAELHLRPGDPAASEAAIAEIVRWRREHQPGGQNCGSVFVNPIPGELAAAQLIDGLGLRGRRVGGAYVSEKHANFIQAGDGATAADVRALIEEIRGIVAAERGIVLRSEVRLVGFDDADSTDVGSGVAL